MREMRFALAIPILALLVWGLLASCAPKATPAPTPAPAVPGPAATTPRVAPATPAAQAAPAPTAAPAPARPAWQAEWEKALAEARKEGKVVIYGPPGAQSRQALTEEFEKAYPGMKVEYTSTMGADVVPKIEAERRGDLFLVDLFISGTGNTLPTVKYSLPIEQFLILPEVKDGKYWFGGKLDFADKEGRYNLCFTTYAKSAMAYNTGLLSPAQAEVLSYWDLTKPEWKGKVVMSDPRIAGPGGATGTFMALNSQLGLDFLRALAKNDVVLSRDQRVMAEWVARGKYAIQLAPDDWAIIELMKVGMPLRFQYALKEGTYATAAYGSVVYLDKAPHPSAAKIYLNWLLTKEGQTAWSKSSAYPSRRVDVPTEHLDPGFLLKPGVSYLASYKEDVVNARTQVRKDLLEIFGK